MGKLEPGYKTIFQQLREKENDKRLEQGKPKLTMEMLADEFGVIKTTISNYENGTTKPSYEALKSYHQHFNIPYETLMGEGGGAEKKEHIMVCDELGLSSEAIDTIKALSEKSLYMLNKVLSNGKNSDTFLKVWFGLCVNMNYSLNSSGHRKKNDFYKNSELQLSQLSIDYTNKYIIPKFNRVTKIFINKMHKGFSKKITESDTPYLVKAAMNHMFGSKP